MITSGRTGTTSNAHHPSGSKREGFINTLLDALVRDRVAIHVT